MLLLTLMGLCFPSELFRVAAGRQRCLSVCGRVPCSLLSAPAKQRRLCASQLPDAAVGKDTARALPSGVLNLAVEEWERLCKRTADEKLLPAVFSVWCLQRDLLAAPGVAVAAQTEPQLLPRGCGTWQGVQGGAASVGALEASCRSVLPHQVWKRCVQTFMQPSAWCRLDVRCIPSASSVWPGG